MCLKMDFEMIISSSVARKVGSFSARTVERSFGPGTARSRESFSGADVEVGMSSASQSSLNWPVAIIS